MVGRIVATLLALLVFSHSATAQSNNAAPAYKQAFTAFGIRPYGNAEAGLLTQEDHDFIGNLGPMLSHADRVRVDTILAKAKPAFDQLLEGSRARKCDWDLDRSQGFELMLPHLSAMRQTTRLVRAQALVASNDVDRGLVLESLGALGRLGAHASQDKVLVSSLVGSAIGSVLTQSANYAIESGSVDQKHATQLLEALGPLKAADAFRYSDAVRGEFDMIQAHAKKPTGVEDMQQLMGDRGLSDQEREQLRDPDKFAAMLQQTKQIYERTAAAFENPDPEEARRELKRIEQLVEGGRAGLLAKMVLPAFSKAFESKLKSDAELAALIARLQAIAEGKLEQKDFVNAAMLLARAAAAASAMPEDAQDAIEMVRVAPAALEPLALERASMLLERSQRSIGDTLAQAAALTKCDFKILRMPEPSLDVRLLGGLRAATRIVLADGLRQARAQKQSAACVPALISVYRTAVLLSTDPTLARSHVSQSIWSEATAALEQALAIGPLPADPRAELERAMGTMPTGDPFGWRKAFENDVARIVRWNAGWRSGGATPESTEMRERILKQRGPTPALARVALIVAASNQDDRLPDPDAPALERLGDIWPKAAVEAISAQLAALKSKVEDDTGSTLMLINQFDVAYDLPLEEQKAEYRKLDPVRGIVLVDVAATQSQGTAAFVKPFDLLK